MRVYVPTTLSALADVLRTQAVGPAPFDAYAVTPDLRAGNPTGDIEELEDDALQLAAAASLALLAADPEPPARRVVLTGDVPEAAVRPIGSDGQVEVSAVVPFSRLASLHVDDIEAEPAVAAARSALTARPPTPTILDPVLDAVEEHTLLWYAPQEMADLVAAG